MPSGSTWRLRGKELGCCRCNVRLRYSSHPARLGIQTSRFACCFRWFPLRHQFTEIASSTLFVDTLYIRALQDRSPLYNIEHLSAMEFSCIVTSTTCRDAPHLRAVWCVVYRLTLSQRWKQSSTRTSRVSGERQFGVRSASCNCSNGRDKDRCVIG